MEEGEFFQCDALFLIELWDYWFHGGGAGFHGGGGFHHLLVLGGGVAEGVGGVVRASARALKILGTVRLARLYMGGRRECHDEIGMEGQLVQQD